MATTGAIVRRVGSAGLTLVGKGNSGHWIPMDASADHGGGDAATRPLELLLIGLGGCTAMDVLSILARKRVKLDDFEVALEADRAPEHPKALTAIRLTYHFYGDGLPLEDLRSAVELSEEKYCSVSATLRQAAPIEARIEVHPLRGAR